MKTDALTGPNPITQGIQETARRHTEETTQAKVNLPELKQVQVEISDGNKGNNIDTQA
jgi:hypothetical protein